MSAFAIAHVRAVEFGPEIVEYLERVDGTLEPYGGRFIVHAPKDLRVVEGGWTGDAIVIEFPSMERAAAWWDSPGYQAIVALRTRHMAADVVLVDGTPDGYRARDAVSNLR